MTQRDDRAATKYAAAMRKLRESEEINQYDRNVICDLDTVLTKESLDADNLGKARWGNHLDNLRLMAERTGCLAAALKPGDEGEAAMTTLLEHQTNKQEFAPNTISTYLQSLQLCGRRLVDEDEHPEVYDRFDDLDPQSYRPDDPTPLRTNIIEWHGAIAMAETRTHIRDHAMILSQWAAGTRPESEMWPLQFKHVECHDDHVVLSIPTEAKDGERRDVYLFAGSAVFRRWFKKEHPARLECEDGPGPETYVWTHYNSNEHLGYSRFSGVFRNAGKEADIETDYSPLHFRRSRASILASRPAINEQDLRNHFGWSWTSEKPRNYIATFGGETGKHVANADGASINWEDPTPIAPVTCPSCDQQTTRQFEDCIHCNSALPATDELDERIVEAPGVSDVDLLDLIMDGDVTGDTIRELRKVEGVLRTRPGVLDDLDELEKLADRYHADDDDNGGVQAVFGPAGVGVNVSKAASGAAAKWGRAKHAALKLHPGLENYPPSPKRGAGIVAGQLAIVAAAVVTLWATGALEALIVGDVFAVAGAVIALIVGMALVVRDLPTIDESVDELKQT